MRFKITHREGASFKAGFSEPYTYTWDDLDGLSDSGGRMFIHEKATFKDMLAHEDFCRYTLDKTYEIV